MMRESENSMFETSSGWTCAVRRLNLSKQRNEFNRTNKIQRANMKPTIILSLFMVIAHMVLVARDSGVEAGLIHIYHRYKPKINEELLNSSSSSQHSVEQLEDPDQNILEGGEIEFTSPMKRIMELISHHPPVIVVSSDSASQNQENVPKTNSENSMLNFVQASATSQLQANPMNLMGTTGGTGDRQQWTIISPSQMVQQQQQQQQQQPQPNTILTGQQQQLIQTTVPYEQYYISPGQMNDINQQQFAIVPTNIGFNPANSYQQLATLPYGQQISQIAGIQPQAQQLANAEERTQPIFLSSYVPEVQVDKQVVPFQQVQSAPNSIQQIQQSQQPERKVESVSDNKDKTKTDTKERKKSGENSDDDDPSDGGKRELSYDPDEDETGKSKRDSPNKLNDEPNDDIDEPSNSSGSSTYQDKYDSDRDEPQSSGSKNYKAEPVVVNGLVGVGLNDECMNCICKASSGCDKDLRCITIGAEEKYCGPFQLTEEYWQKAGSPHDSSREFTSFEECAIDAECAAETVTNYMKKYHKDCDGDENITCMDYARLHRLRPNECGNTNKLANLFDHYWEKFQLCAEDYNSTRNGDDESI